MDIFSAFFLPVFLGASHALEPGHGKTALTLFSVRARFNYKFVLSLIGGITLSHTVVLLVTALALRVFVLDHNASHMFHGIFGAIGSLILFWVAYRVFPDENDSEACTHEKRCSCSHHGSEERQVAPGNPDDSGESRTVGLIGMGGGLVPCPTAVAAFMTSLKSGAILEGISAIFAFVLGMILTLLGLALAAHMFGSKLLARTQNARGSYAYVLSGAIALAGALSLYLALGELRAHS